MTEDLEMDRTNHSKMRHIKNVAIMEMVRIDTMMDS
jgi:hypothetical protein